MKNRPTYLAEIVQHLAMDLVFIDASGIGPGEVWLDHNLDGELWLACRIPSRRSRPPLSPLHPQPAKHQHTLYLFITLVHAAQLQTILNNSL